MIGGEYYIQLKPVDDSLLYGLSSVCPSSTFFSSGRDAIFALITSLPGPRIWVPDFVCKSIYVTLQQTGRQLLFYPVTDQLLPDSAWTSQIQPGDIVFITWLFGIRPTEILSTLAQTGAVVISDLSHKVFKLSNWQSAAAQSTYILTSLRKTMALPDGALLGSQRHEVAAPTEPASESFWAVRAAALLSRGGSANQGFMSDENFHLFKKAEQWADANPAAPRKMSDCARALLATRSENDWESARKETHHNQAILATHLAEKISCPQVKPTRTLPEIAVSSFFPILLEPQQRDKIKNVLADQRIYCPVHWDTSFLDQPHPLSQRILSIPCDARYTHRDMTYIATVITAHL